MRRGEGEGEREGKREGKRNRNAERRKENGSGREGKEETGEEQKQTGRNRNEKNLCGCWLPLRRVRQSMWHSFSTPGVYFRGHSRAHKFHAIEKCWLNYLSTHS